MMGINLLKKKSALTVEELRLKKTVNISGSLGLLILFFVSVLVFILSLNLKKEAENLAALEKKWSEKISSLSEVESYNLIVSQKLETIKKIRSTIDYYGIFSILNSVLPSDVNLATVKLNRDGLMTIDGDTNNSSSLITFFDGLTTKMGVNLKSVILQNIVLSKEGDYRFSLVLKFLKKK